MNIGRRPRHWASLFCCVAVVLISALGCPMSQPALDDEASASGGVHSHVTAIEPSVEDTGSIGTGQSEGMATQDQAEDVELRANAGQVSVDVPANSERRTAQSVDLGAKANASSNVVSRDAARPCDGWPQPDVALLITGRQNGYIEPCGCSGFANAKGGLTRRYSLMNELRDKGWDVLAIDVGNQVDRFGRQAELKFQTTVDILKGMKYGAIGLGPDDLRLSFGELYAAIADVDGAESPFICANVTLFDVPRQFRVIETRLGKVGVTAVLGKNEQTTVGTVDEIELRDTVEALRQVVDEMKGAECELRILLAHASIDESKELARQFPEFDLVVTAGGAGEPPMEPEKIDGSNAQLVQVGTKGMFVGVVGLYRDPDTPPRYERVDLDDRFEDSRKVLDSFASYQNTLQELGLEGLGLRPVHHPSGRSFVGSEACAECHEIAYEIFENTPHFHATLSLSEPTERSGIPRHFDPECISCHMTGWNPQGYFPYESGYLDFEADAALHSTGCESCHGPGSAHTDAENGEIDVTEDEIQQLRQEMVLTLDEARDSKCYECHDLDNSPAFQEDGAFEEYWEQVKHEGKY